MIQLFSPTNDWSIGPWYETQCSHITVYDFYPGTSLDRTAILAAVLSVAFHWLATTNSSWLAPYICLCNYTNIHLTHTYMLKCPHPPSKHPEGRSIGASVVSVGVNKHPSSASMGLLVRDCTWIINK